MEKEKGHEGKKSEHMSKKFKMGKADGKKAEKMFEKKDGMKK